MKLYKMHWLRKNWISVLSLLIAVGTLVYTYNQSSLAYRQTQLHIEPEIKTYLNLPKGEKPVFTVANEGSIPAASVSAGYRIFVFKKETREIYASITADKTYNPESIYSELLKPAEHTNTELLGIAASDCLIVYVFHLKYFRESDMHEYNRTDYYFIDEGLVLNHTQFRTSKLYHDVMAEITAFTMLKMNQNPESIQLEPNLLTIDQNDSSAVR